MSGVRTVGALMVAFGPALALLAALGHIEFSQAAWIGAVSVFFGMVLVIGPSDDKKP